ncbi:MAG TPA: hypothetical protein VF121_06015 [Thermoanaerobaculia bacterium]|nr:hypothetical protein [Thermoanaerobaculia bacterium]
MKRTLFPLIAAVLLLAAVGAAQAGAGHEGFRHRGAHLDRLSEELGLSEAQKASAAQLHERMREAMRVAHEEFETDFTALLTPEQAAKLATLKEQRHGRRRGAGPR